MLREPCYIPESIDNKVKLVQVVVCLIVINTTSQRLQFGAQALLEIDPVDKWTIHRDISFMRREGYISGEGSCWRNFHMRLSENCVLRYRE